MYYEVFEEIRAFSNANTGPEKLKLINKCYIDSVFEVRSQINPIYKDEDDFKRLTGNSYAYIFYQKIISGIAKAIFVGMNPWSWDSSIFLRSGRLSVPGNSLEIDGRHPLLYFQGDVYSYDNSSLKKWEDELFLIQDSLNQKLKLNLSREGFRAHLYRILEILFSMKSSSPKRRTSWSVFLHELLILQKTFSREDLLHLNFQIEQRNFFSKVVDTSFPTLDYLEFKFLAKQGIINTDEISIQVTEKDPLKVYSEINLQLTGKIPLCHFYINEHMFVGKEEYSLNQYIEYYISPWTKSSKLFISYLENGTAEEKCEEIADFARTLKVMKYSIILGFHEVLDGKKLSYSAEPRMVKD